MSTKAPIEDRVNRMHAVLASLARTTHLLDEMAAKTDAEDLEKDAWYYASIRKDLQRAEVSRRLEADRLNDTVDRTLIRFVDGNCAGVIYLGTRADMDDLSNNGGMPCPVGESFVGDRGGVWEVRRWLEHESPRTGREAVLVEEDEVPSQVESGIRRRRNPGQEEEGAK